MSTALIHDPIGDMMNRLKIAGEGEQSSVVIPYSKLRFAIATLLEKRGFVKAVTKRGKKVVKSMEVELAYHTDGRPRISAIRRLSKLSRRMYLGAEDIRPVRRGYGMLVLTTPKGVMAGNDAKKEKVGGEALFEVW